MTMTGIAQDACGPRLWAEMRSSWAIALLARAPSVPLTWIFARAGLSPMQVTGIGFALALSLPLQAALLPLTLAVWAVAFSGWLFQVLDCVDGTLARLGRRTSKRGADADFLVDMTQWGLLYLSIGLLADRTLDTGAFWTAVACAAAWGRLLARVIRDRLATPDTGQTAPLRLMDYPAAILAGISGLIAFFALLGPWIGLGVALLALYSLLDILEAALPLASERSDKTNIPK
jgi:phosphatidylglycerophosphate synthase